MVRAREQDSIMSYLRGICYPAKIWIPYREIHNRSPVRKLLIMGWTKEVVDDAREIIYNFIKTEIGENISGLHPVLSQQDVRKTWSRSPSPSTRTSLGTPSRTSPSPSCSSAHNIRVSGRDSSWFNQPLIESKRNVQPDQR